MSNAPVANYAVELLYEERPLLSKAEVLTMLRDRCGAASAVDVSSPDGLNFFFPDLRVPAKGSSLPVQVAMTIEGSPLPASDTEPALKQTWDWKRVRDVVAKHTARLTLTDLLAVGLPYKSRLSFFHNVLQGINEFIAPTAILWRPSQRIVSPIALTQALRPGDKRDELKGALNLRRTVTKGPEGIVVDTVGLAAFGLPDLEAGLGERMPMPVEALLRSLARYVYDLGDVVTDGRKVPGPPGEGTWMVRTGRSTVPPDREVLRVGPA